MHDMIKQCFRISLNLYLLLNWFQSIRAILFDFKNLVVRNLDLGIIRSDLLGGHEVLVADKNYFVLFLTMY